MPFLSEFVNLFSAGLSDTKDILFLCWIFFIVSIFFLKYRYTFFFLKRHAYTICNSLLVAIAFSFLFGVILHAYYTINHNLPFNQYVVTFHNEDFSSTQLLHNHVVKAGFGLTAQYFGIDKAKEVDAGVAYVGLIPDVFGILLLVLVVVNIILGILYFLVTERKGVLATFVSGIFFFGIIKNIFDGGLFNYEVIPLLVGLVYIISLDFKINIRKTYSFFIILEIITLSLVFTSSDGMWYFYIKNQLLVGAFVLATLCFCRFFERDDSVRNRSAYILLFIGCIFFLGYIKSINYIEYGLTKVGEHNMITTYKEISDAEKVEQIGSLHIYSYDVSEDIRIFALAKRLDLNYKYMPISSVWTNCVPTMPHYKTNFTVRTLDGNTPKNRKRDVYTMQYRKTNVPNEYHLTAYVSPCVPSNLDVITQGVRSGDVETFWLYGARQHL